MTTSRVAVTAALVVVMACSHGPSTSQTYRTRSDALVALVTSYTRMTDAGSSKGAPFVAERRRRLKDISAALSAWEGVATRLQDARSDVGSAITRYRDLAERWIESEFERLDAADVCLRGSPSALSACLDDADITHPEWSGAANAYFSAGVAPPLSMSSPTTRPFGGTR